MSSIHFVLMLCMCVAVVYGGCDMSAIRLRGNKCLMNNMVSNDTEFLVPTLNDTSAVVNFCKRTITDIKNCIMGAITACASSKQVEVIFGSTGAAVLAAYTGICHEQNNEKSLTCAHQNYGHNISSVVHEFIHDVDAISPQLTTNPVICRPFFTLHESILKIYEHAVMSGDCPNSTRDVWHKYLSTITFPCSDKATDYYPCTIERFNADAISQCYISQGVEVKNAIIPTATSPTHADEICGSKGIVLNCIRNLITKCMHESQITTVIGPTGAELEAGLNCLCGQKNSDLILNCAASVDIISDMRHFSQSVHNHSVAGTLDKQTECLLEKTMLQRVEVKLFNTCDDEHHMSVWKAYLGTVMYQCTDTPTHCYPENRYNGAQSNGSLRRMLLLLGLPYVVMCVVWFNQRP